MAFPANPTNGQTTTINGITYVYSTTTTAWSKQGVVSTASPVSSVAGRTGAVTLTAADIGAGTFPGAITATNGTITNLTTTGIAGTSGTITMQSATTFSSTLTAGSAQITSLGVGTAASGTAGEIRATNYITAFYSDERLKTEIQRIDNALDKVRNLSGVYFVNNDVAESFGYTSKERQVGYLAGQMKSQMPEVVKPAPFDIAQRDDGTEYSKSGENYMTVQYDRVGPLLLEAIKELDDQVSAIKKHLGI